MPDIAVIGAGKWGQGLHFALSQKQEVLITSRTKRDINNFVSLEEALSCKYLVISLSAQSMRGWLEERFKFKDQHILVATKGIEADSGEFLNDIFSKHVPNSNIGYITGPSFAAEVNRSLPTAIVINSENENIYKEFEPLFPDFMKVYYSDDVVGAEIAGAYKNVLAIASGICDGLNLGNNARAALISRGLVEMTRFGKYFGAKDDTFLGLSGAGDLFLTASSTLSRNYRVGLGLADGKTLAQILEELGEVAEGVKTSIALFKLSSKHQIYTPIAKEVKLILDGKNPKQSLVDLLSR
jgi:glycerol-3-phosphate dehydrogenase (NAD(P)+)